VTPSSIISTAGTLASALASITDIESKLRCAATVCDLLAEAMDDGCYGTDVACELRNAKSNAEANIVAVQAEEAEHEAEREARMSRNFPRRAT
jgi:hypothetical protein